MTGDALLLIGLIFAAALLYSSVGHGGASGYIAMMALVGVVPEVMRPAALIMNILVSGIATVQFYRAGCFRGDRFWPFALMSIPFAFLGGMITLPDARFKQLVGLVLLFAGGRLLIPRRQPASAGAEPAGQAPPLLAALLIGAGLGLLSGLTGTGGGIFLSPLILFAGWATPRESGGVSAPFVLVNSIGGLLGQLDRLAGLPVDVVGWCIAAVAGGLIGATVGSRRLGNPMIRSLLGLVVVIAGIKLMRT
jgi:uncharacterized membrane protein YfcA